MILIDLEVEVVVPSSGEYRDPELIANERLAELPFCVDMSGSACLCLVLVIFWERFDDNLAISRVVSFL